MSNVAVIGACGHVGLPFSLVAAQAGHKVYGIDIDIEKVNMLNGDGGAKWVGEISLTDNRVTVKENKNPRKPSLPFYEKDALPLLKSCVDEGRIEFTNEPTVIRNCDIIAIMIGTPVDSENNPRLDDLMTFIEMDLIEELAERKRAGEKDPKILPPLIILRSTVAPGTTEVVYNKILSFGFTAEDFDLVYSPERVQQGNGIEESKILPQLIGTSNSISNRSFNRAQTFFKTFVTKDCIQLSWREAEMAKLMTNMYRYVNFALANEFYMIASNHDVDVHRIIEAANRDYPRMNLPMPGPNVGGPCLYKDGRFLLDGGGAGYNELITTAFNINEGMPDFIMGRLKAQLGNLFNKKVLILGGAFKANSDDTRNSLSFKLRKILSNNGAVARIYDPLIKRSPGKSDFTDDTPLFNNMEPTDSMEFDAVVVMTPHSVFKPFLEEYHFKDNVLIVDIWKFFQMTKTMSGTGIFELPYRKINVGEQHENKNTGDRL